MWLGLFWWKVLWGRGGSAPATFGNVPEREALCHKVDICSALADSAKWLHQFRLHLVHWGGDFIPLLCAYLPFGFLL